MRRIVSSREAILFYVLIAMVTVFALRVENFFDAYNIFERSRYWVAPGLIAIPMTFIIATSGIDLSVGSITAMCGIVLGLLFADAHWNIWCAAVAAVLVGAAAGAVNGGVSGYLRIPPMVVTLATMTLFRGVAMGFSQARAISNFPKSFLWLSKGDAFTFPTTTNLGAAFPVPLIVLLVAMAMGAVLLKRSWFGRFTECLGENETASAFAAINVPQMKLLLYTGCGAVCGIAALFNTALYATAKADAVTGMALDAVACVVIGGTRISGGHGSVLGTLLGLLIIGILKYGLEMAGIRSQYVVILVGALLILTAVLNEWLANVGPAKSRR